MTSFSRACLAICALFAVVGCAASKEHLCEPNCCNQCCATSRDAGTPELRLEDGSSASSLAASIPTSDGPMRHAQGLRMASLGPTSQCSAQQMLTHADPGVRATGASILARLSPESASASDDLGRLMLADSSPEVRTACAHALSKMGASAASQVDRLYGALQDERWQVRYHASLCLGDVGWPAWHRVDELDRTSHLDRDERVRAVALSSTEKVRESWILRQKFLRRM